LLLAQVCAAEQAKLSGSDSTHFDRFGVDVAVEGDRIVVGADFNRPVATGLMTGSAYVFEFLGGSWQEMVQLVPSKPVPKGQFGYAVSCSGGVVAVGAPMVNQTLVPGGRGIVYVYSKPASVWVEQALIDPADALADGFGWDVDLDGDTLLIGAKDAGTGSPGMAYVYVKSGASWTKQAELAASDAAPERSFGYSVALEGDTAIVCAGRADGAQNGSGAAYVFQRNGTTWTETQKLFASDGKSQDWFGIAVDFDGTTIAIGAVYADTGAVTEHGAAYLFGWNGQQWVEQQKLRPRGYAHNDIAGCAVAVDGASLAFTSPNEVQTPGFLHVASKSGSSWLQHLKFTSSDNWCLPGQPCIPSQLGSSVALEGTRLVGGAPNADVAGLQQLGAVYVFDVQMQAPQPTFYCSAKTDAKGCTPRFFHAGIPSASGALTGQLYEVKGYDVQAKVPGMLFYSTSGSASTPFAGGSLCIQQPQKATQMAVTSANALTWPCNGQFSFDFSAWIASGNDPSLTAGQTLWMQYWYRDPGGPPGVNIGLTDGIFVSICP
jgi:hypothetical protein